MIRAVLDTNVLVSGLLSRGGPPGQILDAWIDGQIQIIVSKQSIEELVRVLAYPRIKERLARGQAEKLIEMVIKSAEWVEVKEVLNVLTRDPADNYSLSCALEADADYLVTGNLAHFAEAGEAFHGVRIITPRIFLEILAEQ